MLENDLSRKFSAHTVLSREGKPRDAFQHGAFAGRLITTYYGEIDVGQRNCSISGGFSQATYGRLIMRI